MPTSNEQILDRYIRHQTYLLRYAGGLRNQVLPELVKTEEDLFQAIIKWVLKAEGNRTLTGASGRKWQAEFTQALTTIRKPAWSKITEEVSAQMRELAVNEVAVGATIIETALPVDIALSLPSTTNLHSIVASQPFQGRTLKEWMGRTAEADVQKMLSYAKIGIVQGQTSADVARGIIGTRSSRYMDGEARKAFRDLESVILTLTNGIQNEAKQALYQANSDIIETELFVNTLDVRTTMQCIAAGDDGSHGLGDGVYPLGKGPIPPLHFRCRSLRVPYLDPDTFGTRWYNSSTEKELVKEYAEATKIDGVRGRDTLPRGHKTKFDKFARERRNELIGRVPAKTTYGEWLKTQTNEFQNQVLGPTRAEMFRKDGIKLDKFVARDGDVLTLEQLRKKGMEIPDI